MILAGSWFAVRPSPGRTAARSAGRALAQLEKVAASGNPAAFFELAKKVLLQAFGLRWTPPLAAVPGPAEVVVTGSGARVRATIAIPARPSPADPVSPGTGGG